MKNIIPLLLVMPMVAFSQSMPSVNKNPSTLSEARRINTFLISTLGEALKENKDQKGLIDSTKLEKDEANKQIGILNGHIGELDKYARDQYNRADKAEQAKVKLEAKYHKIKWPLVFLAGGLVTLLAFYFLGPLSAVLGPMAVYAPVAAIGGGAITSIIVSFLI